MIAPAALLLVACNKQPTAEFKTDKAEYTAGETVQLSNASVDAQSYQWTFPDGQTSASKNASYSLGNDAPEGTYYIKLEAISRRGNKRSEAIKSFTVKNPYGQLMVWTSKPDAGPITVAVDYTPLGTISLYYTAAPDCGANGCVTATLMGGMHTIMAKAGTYEWTEAVTILPGKCTRFNLQ